MEKKLSVSLTREEARILGQWCQQQQAEAVFFCTVNMDMLPEGYAPRLMLRLKSYVLLSDEDEPGFWYVGALLKEGVFGFWQRCDSLEEALDALKQS